MSSFKNNNNNKKQPSLKWTCIAAVSFGESSKSSRPLRSPPWISHKSQQGWKLDDEKPVECHWTQLRPRGKTSFSTAGGVVKASYSQCFRDIVIYECTLIYDYTLGDYLRFINSCRSRHLLHVAVFLSFCLSVWLFVCLSSFIDDVSCVYCRVNTLYSIQ